MEGKTKEWRNNKTEGNQEAENEFSETGSFPFKHCISLTGLG